jgi:hypothetical protein
MKVNTKVAAIAVVSTLALGGAVFAGLNYDKLDPLKKEIKEVLAPSGGDIVPEATPVE